MVRNSEASCGRSFGGTNVEAAVKLERIAVNNFPREFACKMQSQSAFAGSGGPDNGNQRMIRNSAAAGNWLGLRYFLGREIHATTVTQASVPARRPPGRRELPETPAWTPSCRPGGPRYNGKRYT